MYLLRDCVHDKMHMVPAIYPDSLSKRNGQSLVFCMWNFFSWMVLTRASKFILFGALVKGMIFRTYSKINYGLNLSKFIHLGSQASLNRCFWKAWEPVLLRKTQNAAQSNIWRHQEQAKLAMGVKFNVVEHVFLRFYCTFCCACAPEIVPAHAQWPCPSFSEKKSSRWGV